MTTLPPLPNRFELGEAAALASAISRVSEPSVRATMVEALLSRLEESSLPAGQLCGAVLAAIGDEDSRTLGSAFLERSGEYSGLEAASAETIDVDLVILAIKPSELDACLAAYGVARSIPPELLGSSGLCGWFVQDGGCRVLVTMAGAAGNVQSAMVMSALRQHVTARSAILVGMAAGPEGHVELGDVVVAESVWEYEFARLTSDGAHFQARPHEVSENLIRSAQLLPRMSPKWSAECRHIVRQCNAGLDKPMRLPDAQALESWYPEVHRGVILAGAKLIEDGSVPDLLLTINDRVRAVEMDGAGFAAACTEFGLRWMVVRGIADFGNPRREKIWQFPATVAAAVFVREFVRAGFLNS